MIFRHDVLAGRVAFITGGGTGLGRAIALEMARVGANVVIASRNLAHLEPTVVELQGLGVKALGLQCDVRNHEQVAAAIDETHAAFGRLDILVNNAAGTFRAPTAEITPNGWRTVVDIDLGGTFLCSREAHRIMAPQQSGVILNITTTNAFLGNPGRAHAASAKAGIEALTKTLAVEWGPVGIRVNSIAPGPFPTEGVKQQIWNTPEFMEQVQSSVPLGRLGRPEEVGYLAVFLASDAAGYVTGTTLVADGGRWLNLPGR